MADEKKKGPGLVGYVRGFGRMWGAVGKRNYGKFPWRTVIGAAASVVYIVSPFDLIPDFIATPLGLVDDAAVFGFLLGLVRKDVLRFLEWEAGARQITEGK